MNTLHLHCQPTANVLALAAALALLGWSVAARAGELDEFLCKSKAYQDLVKTPRTPQFRLEALEPAAHAKGTQWFYILDGNQQIALVQDWIRELEMFRFQPPADGRIVQYPIPRIHHWANLLGPRINLHAPSADPAVSRKLTWVRKEGATLELRTEDRCPNGIEGVNNFVLSWDERLGYVWDCNCHYSMPEARDFEFNNLLAGGLAESRNDRKRWQKTIWPSADGNWSYMFHNPLSPLLPRTPAWRDVKAGGFVGFVTEPDINPIVEIQQCNLQVCMATCSEWYDQHIITRPAAMKEADGKYHVRATYRFLSVPGSVARELESAATRVIPPEQRQTLGFLAGKVNDFETFVPSGQVYNGPFWGVGPNTEQAHSGRNSIKLVGAGKGKAVTASPIAGGPPIYGESAKRYRLTCWVKTALKAGGAYVEVDDCFWNWKDVRGTRKSGEVVGESEWKELTLDFQPCPDDPFLLIKLCVDGDGAAWFDDLSLVEVR